MKINIKQIIALFLFVFGMVNVYGNTITEQNDYNKYLDIKNNYSYDLAEQEYHFWNEKWVKAPNQYPYLTKMATAQTQLFSLSGKVEHLNKAEKYLILANEKTHYANTTLLRSLAKNSISHHKFQYALALLSTAENIGEGLVNTKKMLFDVYLEIGDNTCAEEYLLALEANDDFDYFIRKSKWEDHQGNLDNAIYYLEIALGQAQTMNKKELVQWSYSNLADYYGHAGRIEDAYKGYLNALALDPYDAYSLKGIAWIAFSYERNTEEAMRILNQLSSHYHSPDYDLLKSEITAFMGDKMASSQHLNNYMKEVKLNKYSRMYNGPVAQLLIEEKAKNKEAVVIVESEIKERPTPESYSLLAWAFYHEGEIEKAKNIVDAFVLGQSEEPELVYRNAVIYKANQHFDQVLAMKEELLQSTFELGPLREKEIHDL